MILKADLSFSGGLCSTPIELNECSFAQDVIFNRDGTVSGRPDYSGVGHETDDYPLAIKQCNFSGGSSIVVLQTKNSISKLSSNREWEVQRYLTANGSAGGSITQFGDKIICADPAYVGLLYYDYYSNTTGLLPYSPANCELVIADDNYVYTSRGPKIFYSAAGNPEDWPSDNELITSGNDTIIDMIELFGKIYIFKRSGIYVKTGRDETDFSLEKVSNEPCFSRVAVSPRGVYFISSDDVLIFNGSSSNKFSRKIDAGTFIKTESPQRLFYSHAYDQLYIPNPNDGLLYVYDPLKDLWTTYIIDNICCMTEVDAYSLAPSVLQNIAEALKITYISTGTCSLFVDDMGDIAVTVNGVPDFSIDVSNPAYDTFGKIKTYIDGLVNYTCALGDGVVAGDSSIASLSRIGVFLTSTIRSLNRDGIYTGRSCWFGISNQKRIFQGWFDNGVSGVLKSKVNIDFGSPGLLKRPKLLYFDGVASATIYHNLGTLIEKDFPSAGRINYFSQSGVLQRNYMIRLYNLNTFRSCQFEVSGVTV